MDSVSTSVPTTGDTCRQAPSALGGCWARWLDWLGERALPHFGQLSIWLLLGVAAFESCVPAQVFDVVTLRDWPRQGTATILFWLPAEVLNSPVTFFVLRGLLLVGISLWLFQKLLPWSCWLTVFAFTAVWAVHVENSWHTNHCFHMANSLLFIQALWMTICGHDIRAAIREKRYWSTPLYPRWVTLAAIAYIGVFHMAAGLSKLSYSGPDWANGTSLQLWAHLWGYRWSPTTQLILHSRAFTQFLQVGTLIIEVVGLLALFPRLRTWIGLATVGFYLGVLATFSFGFHFNLLFTALYLLPVERWVQQYVQRRSSAVPNQ